MGCDGWGSPAPVRSASICTNFNIVIPFAAREQGESKPAKIGWQLASRKTNVPVLSCGRAIDRLVSGRQLRGELRTAGEVTKAWGAQGLDSIPEIGLRTPEFQGISTGSSQNNGIAIRMAPVNQ